MCHVLQEDSQYCPCRSAGGRALCEQINMGSAPGDKTPAQHFAWDTQPARLSCTQGRTRADSRAVTCTGWVCTAFEPQPSWNFSNLIRVHFTFSTFANERSLVYFLYFEEMKTGLCYHHAVYESLPSIIFWMPEPIFMKLGTYLSLSQWRTSSNHVISLCVCMCIPLTLLSNACVKTLQPQRIHTQQ
jgi:hypothetical protein